MRRVAEALAAGAVIYVVMAACSGGKKERAMVADDGPSEAGLADVGAGGSGGGEDSSSSGGVAGVGTDGSAGAIGLGGMGGAELDAMADAGRDASEDGSLVDAIADALTDPVPDATANQSGTRIKARWLTTADGARQFVGWHDSARSEDCKFTTAADGEIRCLPEGIDQNSRPYYADANCTQRLVLVSDGCRQYGLFVEPSTQPPACFPVAVHSNGQRVFPIGAEHTAATVYRRANNPDSGPCNPEGAPSSPLHVAGAEIPASEFAPGSLIVDP